MFLKSYVYLVKSDIKPKINCYEKEHGTIDKVIRILIVIVIAVLYSQGIISGTLAIVLGVVAAIFLLTSLVGFCPLYKLVGMNTCPAKK